MADSEFHIQLQYGPMLIGVFLNMILYGVLLNQACASMFFMLYNLLSSPFTTYRCSSISGHTHCRQSSLLVNPILVYPIYSRDTIWVRLFVAYLFILETANTGIDMAMMYQPLIAEYGTQKAVMNFPTLFLLEPILIVLISTPIQIYFAWRIRKITQTYWIPGVVVMLALASSAGGFITGVKIAKLKLFADKPELHWSALLWFLTACVADLLITGTLVWNLAQRKTGFAITDSVVDKIIRKYASDILMGFLDSSICAIGDVAFFMALPHTGLNFLWDLTLAKLYTNCLMSTLNARAGLLRPSQNSSSGVQRNALDRSTHRGSRFRPMDRFAEHPRTIMTSQHVYELDNTRTFDSTRSGGKTPFSLQQDVELGITVTKVIETTED
ncbi:hypothetical protein F5876DRAFT_76336 [Lentinula aff. lateritia]|uniref:Uncharacterized protein n=1 Tax=Lentinula aff. lateritia TaxID=2804960 RepID=A0ACC1U254_9AGAR|nr:hypothetical protein F5876DRAFT_76336 [Lentinula aff. lateritia]